MRRSPPFIGVLIAAAVAACHVRVAPAAARGDCDATEWLARAMGVEAGVGSIKGEAKIRFDTLEGSGVVTAFLAARAPAELHLETLDFFGKPQAVLVSDIERFALWIAQESTYYRGPPTPANLARLLPIPLSPRELTSLALGRTPLVAHAGECTVGLAGTATLSLHGADGQSQLLVVDADKGRVVRATVEGERAYELAFDEFESTRGVSYPRKVTMRLASPEAGWALRYVDAAVNEQLDAELFELAPPPGASIVELDAAGEVVPP